MPKLVGSAWMHAIILRAVSVPSNVSFGSSHASHFPHRVSGYSSPKYFRRYFLRQSIDSQKSAISCSFFTAIRASEPSLSRRARTLAASPRLNRSTHSARLSVTARTTGLLVVTLDALRDIVVDHVPDIGLVDTHAKRDSGTDNIHIVVDEGVLDLLPHLLGEPRIIRRCLVPPAPEVFSNFLGFALGKAVDDPGLSPVLADDVEQLEFGVLLRYNPVPEVLPVKTADEFGSSGRPGLVPDIFPDCRDCSRGQGEEGDTGEIFPEDRQLPVLGPEVMAPLRDAVRFVNSDEPDTEVFLRDRGNRAARTSRARRKEA